MTDHDHGGCDGRLARPCDAFTGSQAARRTHPTGRFSLTNCLNGDR